MKCYMTCLFLIQLAGKNKVKRSRKVLYKHQPPES